jgi:hypothetical protein
MKATALDLGTYRTGDGELVHLWYDPLGTLVAERDGPDGREAVDPSVVTRAVKVSDDPYWPDEAPPMQPVLWNDMT